ncbi:MAG: hypothetical protein JJE04_23740 [Acidobacteriia bacterium]|nr:hypothetical protein [Terriglobia bacterium]MBK5294680.1 hypothetical protein [Terriglobia bacterium]
MSSRTANDLTQFIGREPERLNLEERTALAGKWVALEMYSPATLPARRIEAVGESPGGCIKQLNERGLDARVYEFSLCGSPC